MTGNDSMEETFAVEFDATLDEYVDVNRRLAHRLGTYREPRRTSQWVAGLGAAGLVAVIGGRAQWALPTWAIATATILCGAIAAAAYGPFYDRHLEHAARQSFLPLFGDGDTVRCCMELRRGELWCGTPQHSMAFPWSRLAELRVTDPDVEFWFDPGLVVVRGRAFATPAARDAFVRAAGRLSGKPLL